MSAYSAEMLEACRTVTLKVKVLPIFRWDRAFCGERSRGRSRPRPEVFTGLWGASVAMWKKGKLCLFIELSYLCYFKSPKQCLYLKLTQVKRILSPHLDRCYCWPHLQTSQSLNSGLRPPRCAAPPGTCWSEKGHQGNTQFGTETEINQQLAFNWGIKAQVLSHQLISLIAPVNQHNKATSITFSNCLSSNEILAVPDCLTPEP